MSKIKVGVHHSVFHSDELVAIALIKYLDDVEVTRTRDEEILKTMEILVDVGGEYSPDEALYDHHQFKKDDPFYGLCSAGLVWKDTKEYISTEYEDLTDLEAFIDAVDRRDTRVGYDPSNVYEPVFEAITACNDIDPMCKNQDDRFNIMLNHVEGIIAAIASKNVEAYADLLEAMEILAEVNTKNKIPQYEQRQLDAVDLGDVIVTKFFPEWRQASKITGKPFVMPGDLEGQYKVMVDTTTIQIAATKDEVFTHANGFISIVAPNETSTHLGIALTNGKLFEVPYSEIRKVIG